MERQLARGSGGLAGSALPHLARASLRLYPIWRVRRCFALLRELRNRLRQEAPYGVALYDHVDGHVWRLRAPSRKVRPSSSPEKPSSVREIHLTSTTGRLLVIAKRTDAAFKGHDYPKKCVRDNTSASAGISAVLTRRRGFLHERINDVSIRLKCFSPDSNERGQH